MKKLIFILSLVLPCGVLAQTTTNAPPAPTMPTSATQKKPKLPEPTSATAPDNTGYLSKPALTRQVDADLAAIQGKPCDIIFIGDSITAHWEGLGVEIWNKEYVPRHALDFGVSGDRTQNVLWRLDNMPVKNLKPKVAVIMIGTNNIRYQPRNIADGVKAVLDKTQAIFPGVKIILVSILPNSRANAKMMAANAIIKGYADDKSIFYLDLVPLMPEVTTTLPNGKTAKNYKGLSKDHLHPDASGYRIWADAMEPLLTKLLAGG